MEICKRKRWFGYNHSWDKWKEKSRTFINDFSLRTIGEKIIRERECAICGELQIDCRRFIY